MAGSWKALAGEPFTRLLSITAVYTWNPALRCCTLTLLVRVESPPAQALNRTQQVSTLMLCRTQGQPSKGYLELGVAKARLGSTCTGTSSPALPKVHNATAVAARHPIAKLQAPLCRKMASSCAIEAHPFAVVPPPTIVVGDVGNWHCPCLSFPLARRHFRHPRAASRNGTFLPASSQFAHRPSVRAGAVEAIFSPKLHQCTVGSGQECGNYVPPSDGPRSAVGPPYTDAALLPSYVQGANAGGMASFASRPFAHNPANHVQPPQSYAPLDSTAAIRHCAKCGRAHGASHPCRAPQLKFKDKPPQGGICGRARAMPRDSGLCPGEVSTIRHSTPGAPTLMPGAQPPVKSPFGNFNVQHVAMATVAGAPADPERRSPLHGNLCVSGLPAQLGQSTPQPSRQWAPFYVASSLPQLAGHVAEPCLVPQASASVAVAAGGQAPAGRKPRAGRNSSKGASPRRHGTAGRRSQQQQQQQPRPPGGPVQPVAVQSGHVTQEARKWRQPEQNFRRNLSDQNKMQQMKCVQPMPHVVTGSSSRQQQLQPIVVAPVFQQAAPSPAQDECQLICSPKRHASGTQLNGHGAANMANDDDGHVRSKRQRTCPPQAYTPGVVSYQNSSAGSQQYPCDSNDNFAPAESLCLPDQGSMMRPECQGGTDAVDGYDIYETDPQIHGSQDDDGGLESFWQELCCDKVPDERGWARENVTPCVVHRPPLQLSAHDFGGLVGEPDDRLLPVDPHGGLGTQVALGNPAGQDASQREDLELEIDVASCGGGDERGVSQRQGQLVELLLRASGLCGDLQQVRHFIQQALVASMQGNVGQQ